MPFLAAHGLVATQYAQFGRAFFGLADSLNYLVQELKDAYQHATQQSRGDFTALDEIIGDYWRTIIDCKALYEKNRLYGMRSGPLANIEWNLVIQPEAAALQQRLLLQQTKIQIIVEPLRLDLLRQILTGVHQVQDTVNDVYALVQRLVDQGATEQQQQLQLLWSCPVEIAQRFHAAAQGGTESQTGVAIRPLSEATDAFLYHFERSTRDAGSPDREHLSLLKCVWLIEQIEGHADLGHAANRFYWRSYVRGLKLRLSQDCRRFNSDHGSDHLALTASVRPWPDSEFFIWPPIILGPLLPPIVTFPDLIMEEILVAELARPRPSLDRRLRLLRGPNGKMRMVISAVERIGEEERSDSQTLNFNLEVAELVPLFAICLDGGLPKCILRTEWDQAELEFRSIREVLKFQSAMTGYEVYKDYSKQVEKLGLFLTTGTLFEVGAAHIQLWVPRASERPPKTASTPGSDSASPRASFGPDSSSQSSLRSRDSTFSLEGPRRGSAATSTQSMSAVQPTLSAKAQKAKEPARVPSERVTLEEGPQPPLLVLFLTAITPHQITGFDPSTAPGGAGIKEALWSSREEDQRRRPELMGSDALADLNPGVFSQYVAPTVSERTATDILSPPQGHSLFPRPAFKT
ncbi:hypothetical protein, variant [Exophiala mesophila]|uniref:Uncharacterized protein n=1 Tax=Exophiala mesophila TaxID=212818 RepID=A0A0D1Z9C7_EXOME|nr:hypothetical protein, variant [Exophiala mesophila]KIV90624.1 hypothetical protein, variant [Exophiala mesophila]